MFRKVLAVTALIISLAGCSGGKPKGPDLAGTWKIASRPATKPDSTPRITDEIHASWVLMLNPTASSNRHNSSLDRR